LFCQVYGVTRTGLTAIPPCDHSVWQTTQGQPQVRYWVNHSVSFWYMEAAAAALYRAPVSLKNA
jgi:hypothetical protein